ncbi:MAG: ComEC/Rec2 family competence protein [Epsilonproteobacteria bacterium]|nr:ComEC/Rec2 family competence protein [Campylobacterota bacterium]
MWKYVKYVSFVSHNQFIHAKVINQYKKPNHWVLKLKNSDIEFYTTTKDDLKDILNYQASMYVVTKYVSFWGYLTKFYAPTYKLGVFPPPTYKTFIASQHKNKKLANMYNALYFGDSLYYQTRVELSTLGLSHLFALSGLHLAVISALLYLILTPIYNRFIPPYRNRNIDLFVVILPVLLGYVYFVNFPPSLVRSFVMEVVIFAFAFALRDVFRVDILVWSVLIILALFPAFIYNIGFFLSVIGVFLIFSFFYFIKPTFISSIIILPIYLYISMFIVVHHFFGNFNVYQLLSPIFSMLFTIFYPISWVLHLVGMGGIFDDVILSYLQLGNQYENIHISSTVFYGYLMLLFILFLQMKTNKIFNFQIKML